MSGALDETFRGTMRGCTPDGEPTTVIVTRQGLGRAAQVWLTFNGAIKTTVVMTNPETMQLGELLTKATAARQGKTGATP
ncbi:MAG: hypothetical protein ACRDXB_13890 [Actinomycetes bacterium]